MTASSDPKANESGPSKDVVPVTATVSTPKTPVVQKKRRRRKLWSNGLMRRKKSTPCHRKESNGAESDEEEGDDDEEEGKAAERMEEEQDVNESVQMDVENKENSPSSGDRRGIPKRVQNFNGHISSEEGDCTDSSMDGIDNGKPSGTVYGERRNRKEIQPMEHTRYKRVEPGTEEDAGIERRMRRMTRGLKSQAQQQQRLDVDTAMKILERKNQPLVVDHAKLKDLLQKVVVKTEGYEVDRLEKLYARLCQSIYRHRKNPDKTALIQEMKKEVEEFS